MTRDEAIQHAIATASKAGQAGHNAAMTDALTRLSGAWLDIARELAPTPKPASYLVDRLEPHRFRNDGSDPNQNACTYWVPGENTFQCGYGTNAQIHRRMLRQGKNAEPAPTPRAVPVRPEDPEDIRVCLHHTVVWRNGDHWVHPGTMTVCDNPPLPDHG